MFDVGAPHQDEPAPPIDRRGIDDGEAGLAAALRGCADARGSETANEAEGQSDEGEHDDERDDKAHDQRALRAKQAIHLRQTPPLEASIPRPARLKPNGLRSPGTNEL